MMSVTITSAPHSPNALDAGKAPKAPSSFADILQKRAPQSALDQLQHEIDALYVEFQELPPELRASDPKDIHGLIDFLREHGWKFFKHYSMAPKKELDKHIKSAITEGESKKAEKERAEQKFHDIDPFDLPYEMVRDLNSDEYWNLTDRLEALYGD